MANTANSLVRYLPSSSARQPNLFSVINGEADVVQDLVRGAIQLPAKTMSHVLSVTLIWSVGNAMERDCLPVAGAYIAKLNGSRRGPVIWNCGVAYTIIFLGGNFAEFLDASHGSQ